MNKRQIKKYLKKQIAKLQLDNDLMRKIIANDTKMQAIYDVFIKPLDITHTMLSFQEFKVRMMIPADMADVEGIIEYTKQSAAGDLFEGIRENITYEIDDEYRPTSVTASIFVGRING